MYYILSSNYKISDFIFWLFGSSSKELVFKSQKTFDKENISDIEPGEYLYMYYPKDKDINKLQMLNFVAFATRNIDL
jgi:hypothetical protein